MADENPEQTQKLVAAIEKSGTDPLTEKGLKDISNLLSQADQRAERKEGADERNAMIERAYAEEQNQILENMNGLQRAAHKMAERSAKLAKMGATKIKDAAGTQLKKVAGMAGSIVDWLIKGAGLVALWALFKWLSGDGAAMFTKVYEFVIDIGKWFILLFTDPMAALEQLWNGMLKGAASIGSWIWDNTFGPLWA